MAEFKALAPRKSWEYLQFFFKKDKILKYASLMFIANHHHVRIWPLGSYMWRAWRKVLIKRKILLPFKVDVEMQMF